jgi:hypothetical protein
LGRVGDKVVPGGIWIAVLLILAVDQQSRSAQQADGPLPWLRHTAYISHRLTMKAPMRNISINGMECENASDALQWANASGGNAIFVGGKYLCVSEAESNRLVSDGVPLAHICDHEMPDGSWRIMFVPTDD